MNALQKVASGYICKNGQPKVLVTLQIKKSVQSSIGNKPINLFKMFFLFYYAWNPWKIW